MSAVLKSVPRRPRRTITKDVEVEFDLDDFDDEDLLAELAARNLQTAAPTVELWEICDAMAARQDARALELMRVYLMDVTGRVLP